MFSVTSLSSYSSHSLSSLPPHSSSSSSLLPSPFPGISGLELLSIPPTNASSSSPTSSSSSSSSLPSLSLSSLSFLPGLIAFSLHSGRSLLVLDASSPPLSDQERAKLRDFIWKDEGAVRVPRTLALRTTDSVIIYLALLPPVSPAAPSPALTACPSSSSAVVGAANEGKVRLFVLQMNGVFLVWEKLKPASLSFSSSTSTSSSSFSSSSHTPWVFVSRGALPGSPLTLISATLHKQSATLYYTTSSPAPSLSSLSPPSPPSSSSPSPSSAQTQASAPPQLILRLHRCSIPSLLSASSSSLPDISTVSSPSTLPLSSPLDPALRFQLLPSSKGCFLHRTEALSSINRSEKKEGEEEKENEKAKKDKEQSIVYYSHAASGRLVRVEMKGKEGEGGRWSFASHPTSGIMHALNEKGEVYTMVESAPTPFPSSSPPSSSPSFLPSPAAAAPVSVHLRFLCTLSPPSSSSFSFSPAPPFALFRNVLCLLPIPSSSSFSFASLLFYALPSGSFLSSLPFPPPTISRSSPSSSPSRSSLSSSSSSSSSLSSLSVCQHSIGIHGTGTLLFSPSHIYFLSLRCPSAQIEGKKDGMDEKVKKLMEGRGSDEGVEWLSQSLPSFQSLAFPLLLAQGPLYTSSSASSPSSPSSFYRVDSTVSSFLESRLLHILSSLSLLSRPLPPSRSSSSSSPFSTPPSSRSSKKKKAERGGGSRTSESSSGGETEMSSSEREAERGGGAGGEGNGGTGKRVPFLSEEEIQERIDCFAALTPLNLHLLPQFKQYAAILKQIRAVGRGEGGEGEIAAAVRVSEEVESPVSNLLLADGDEERGMRGIEEEGDEGEQEDLSVIKQALGYKRGGDILSVATNQALTNEEFKLRHQNVSSPSFSSSSVPSLSPSSPLNFSSSSLSSLSLPLFETIVRYVQRYEPDKLISFIEQVEKLHAEEEGEEEEAGNGEKETREKEVEKREEEGTVQLPILHSSPYPPRSYYARALLILPAVYLSSSPSSPSSQPTPSFLQISNVCALLSRSGRAIEALQLHLSSSLSSSPLLSRQHEEEAYRMIPLFAAAVPSTSAEAFFCFLSHSIKKQILYRQSGSELKEEEKEGFELLDKRVDCLRPADMNGGTMMDTIKLIIERERRGNGALEREKQEKHAALGLPIGLFKQELTKLYTKAAKEAKW